MPKLFIDSNIFIADFKMKSPAFKILFDVLPKTDIQLCVSHVVMLEVTNKYKERIKEIYDEIISLNKKITKFDVDLGINLDRKKIHEKSIEYINFFKSTIQSNGTIYPIPEISHFDIINRELSRQKPFKPNGAGYRDYLIWQSILLDLIKYKNEVHFISNNIQDFMQNGEIAIDLQMDLEENNIPIDLLKIYNSLEEYNEIHTKKHLHTLDQLNVLVKNDAFIGTIIKWLEKANEKMHDEDVYLNFIGIEQYHCQAKITNVNKILSVQIDDIKSLTSGEYFIQISTKLNLKIVVDADYDDYIKYKDVYNYFGDNELEKPFMFVTHESDFDTNVIFLLIIDGQTFNINSFEEAYIEGPVASSEIEPYKNPVDGLKIIIHNDVPVNSLNE